MLQTSVLPALCFVHKKGSTCVCASWTHTGFAVSSATYHITVWFCHSSLTTATQRARGLGCSVAGCFFEPGSVAAQFARQGLGYRRTSFFATSTWLRCMNITSVARRAWQIVCSCAQLPAGSTPMVTLAGGAPTTAQSTQRTL